LSHVAEAKAGVWYSVAQKAGACRTYRAAAILSAEALDEAFARPADFDRASYWTKGESLRRLVRVPRQEAHGLREDIHIVLELRDGVCNAVHAPHDEVFIHALPLEVFAQGSLRDCAVGQSVRHRMRPQLPVQVGWDVRLDADPVPHGGPGIGARSFLFTTRFSRNDRAPLPSESQARLEKNVSPSRKRSIGGR